MTLDFELDAINEAVNESIGKTINSIYPDLSDSNYDVRVNLLSKFTDDTENELLQYIDYAYEEIADELKHNKEYLINLIDLNVKLTKGI